jgi:hypothetical protein
VRPIRRSSANSFTEPSSIFTRNTGFGFSSPGTATCFCPIGNRRGGNSVIALSVLNEDSTSHATGPNITKRPSAR